MGIATALQLIKEGHSVYGAARRIEKMAELEYSGGYPIQMDVTNGDEMISAVNRIIQEQGRINVLIMLVIQFTVRNQTARYRCNHCRTWYYQN